MTRRRAIGLALAFSLAVAACLPGRAHGSGRVARVTHYWATGSPMASGDYPFVGAVACSYDLPLYTWLRTPDGLWWQCLDRGRLAPTWVDFYGWNAEAAYGSYTEIEVFE